MRKYWYTTPLATIIGAGFGQVLFPLNTVDPAVIAAAVLIEAAVAWALLSSLNKCLTGKWG